jgi:hypothetical protein
VQYKALHICPFFLFVAKKNLGWCGFAVGRLISIRNTYIKDCSLAFGPKAMDSEVTAEFWGRFCAGCACHLDVSTWLDEWFYYVEGWGLVDLPYHFINGPMIVNIIGP